MIYAFGEGRLPFDGSLVLEPSSLNSVEFKNVIVRSTASYVTYVRATATIEDQLLIVPTENRSCSWTGISLKLGCAFFFN